MFLTMVETSLTAILLAGIAGLATVVVVMYKDGKKETKKHNEEIRQIHNIQISLTQELNNSTKEFLVMTQSMRGSVDKMSDAVERNTSTINDLHKYILQNK
jgi:hypothetical protein